MLFLCREENILFEGGRRNRDKIHTPYKGYGVVIMPEPIYKYPKDHPCYGCVFVFQVNAPSCMTGGYSDKSNCINAFYKKMQARWKAELEKKLQNKSDDKKERRD
jgi:hypothetical protein